MPEESSHILILSPGETERALNEGSMEVLSSATPEGQTKLKYEKARKIFGEDFLGQEEIEKALEIKINPEQVPDIHFSLEELRRGRELGQRLILRVPYLDDKNKIPLTMDRLETHVMNIFKRTGKQEVRFQPSMADHDNEWWITHSDFYLKDVPRNRWSLVSSGVLDGTWNSDYLKQTQALVHYLESKIFGNTTLPHEYEIAINEFEKDKGRLARMLNSTSDYDRSEATRLLAELKINKLARHTAVEVWYDLLTYYIHSGGKYMLDKNSTWTLTNGAIKKGIVSTGMFGVTGIRTLAKECNDLGNTLGVCLSR